MGKSVSRIAKDVLYCARDILALKAGADALVIDTEENIAALTAMGEQCTEDGLSAVIRILSSVDAELRYSVSPKIVLETACLRAGKLCDDGADALNARITRLEREFESIASGAVPRAVAATPQPQPQDITDERSVWGKLITYFRKNGPMTLYSLLCNTHDFKIEDGSLVITPDGDAEFMQFSDPETDSQMGRALSALGINLTVTVNKRASRPDMDNEIEHIKKLMSGGKANLNITR